MELSEEIKKVSEALNSEEWFNVEDIYTEIKQGGQRISRATIYHNIEKLYQIGIICQCYKNGRTHFKKM